jgi:hypothetical protein
MVTILYCPELSIFRIRGEGKEIARGKEELEAAGVSAELIQFAVNNPNTEIEIK